MVAESNWRELCRFEDLLTARAVATSIAAMEFDVRLCAADAPAHADEMPHPGPPPYVVQVTSGHWGELTDVLDEIIEEQREFDRMITQRRSASRHARIVTVITLTGAAELLLLLALAEW